MQKICPKCSSVESQRLNGKNRSGTQSIVCGKCFKYYTLNPKTRAIPEEVRSQAIKMHFAGASGRTVGKVMGFNKANIYNWAKKNPADVDK